MKIAKCLCSIVDKREKASPAYSRAFSPGMIKQFLRDVDWGEVDYLIVDTPPGTSDEHLSAVQYLSAARIDGAVIITTPQVSKHPGGAGSKLGCVQPQDPFLEAAPGTCAPTALSVDPQKLR